MFEQVGRHRQGRRRLWGPLLLTITLNSAGLTALIVSSGHQLVSQLQRPMPDFPWSSDLDRFIAVLRSQQVPHRRVCGDDELSRSVAGGLCVTRQHGAVPMRRPGFERLTTAMTRRSDMATDAQAWGGTFLMSKRIEADVLGDRGVYPLGQAARAQKYGCWTRLPLRARLMR